MDLLQINGSQFGATVTALECNIEYRFRICAVMENGRGPWNEIGPVRTGKFILNPRFLPPRNMLKAAGCKNTSSNSHEIRGHEVATLSSITLRNFEVIRIFFEVNWGQNNFPEVISGQI